MQDSRTQVQGSKLVCFGFLISFLLCKAVKVHGDGMWCPTLDHAVGGDRPNISIILPVQYQYLIQLGLFESIQRRFFYRLPYTGFRLETQRDDEVRKSLGLGMGLAFAL